MPTSRAKLRKQNSGSGGGSKLSGGSCNHTGMPHFASLAKARQAAAEDEESRACRYCRGAHNWPAKRGRRKH